MRKSYSRNPVHAAAARTTTSYYIVRQIKAGSSIQGGAIQGLHCIRVMNTYVDGRCRGLRSLGGLKHEYVPKVVDLGRCVGVISRQKPVKTTELSRLFHHGICVLPFLARDFAHSTIIDIGILQSIRARKHIGVITQ